MTIIAKLFDPAGNLLSELPDFITVSPQSALNDVGGWSMDYPKAGLGANLLVQDQDLEVWIYQDNQQIYQGLIEDDSWDQVQEETGEAIVTLSGRDTAALLDFAVVYPDGGVTHKPATQVFTTKTIGYIVNKFLTEAQARGAIPNITWNFTALVDSNNAAWAQTLTMTFKAGVSVLAVLQGLAQAGYIDWKMVGHQLRIYNPGTVLASQKAMTFRRGKHITSAPRQRTRRTLATAFLVQGDNDTTIDTSNAGAIAARGRKEAYFSQGGTTDTATLTSFGQLQLSIRDIPRLSKTHNLVFSKTDDPNLLMPWIDWNVGDYINTDVVGTIENYRIVQFSATMTSNGPISGQVTLNDRFMEREVQVAQILSGIQGGGVTGTSTPTTPTPPPATVDTLAPAAPSSVTVTSAVGNDAQGNPFATATVTWPAVTTNSDGTALTDLDHYEVTYVYSGGGSVTPGIVSTQSTRVDYTNLPMNTNLQWKVWAVDFTGNRSLVTTSAITTTATDTQGPTLAPSTPTLDTTTYLSLIKATWDGKQSDGSLISTVGDFDHIEVHASTVSGFAPSATTLIGTLLAAGNVPVPGDPGTTLYIVFVSVDKLNNKSPKSAQASGVVSSVNTNDIAAGAVNNAALAAAAVQAANLANGSVTTPAIANAAIVTAAIANAAITNALIANLAVTDAKINDLAVGKLTAGVLVASYVQLGGRLTTASGGVQTGARVELDGAGLRAYNAAGTQTVGINSDGSATFSGSLISATITTGQLQTDTTQLNYVTLNSNGIQVTHEGTTNLVLNPDMVTGYTNGPTYGGAYLTTDPAYTGVGRPGVGSLTADPYMILIPSTLGGSNGTPGPNALAVYVGGSAGSFGVVGSTSTWMGTLVAAPTGQQQLGYAVSPLASGTTYTYSVFIYSGNANTYIDPTKFGLQESAGSGRFVTGASAGLVLLPNARWYRITGTVTLPSGWNGSNSMLMVDWVRTAAGAYIGSASNYHIYYDGAQVELKGHVTDLITGNMPNGTWAGTANASNSNRASLVLTDLSTSSAAGAWPNYYGEFATSLSTTLAFPRLILGPQFPVGIPPQPMLLADPGSGNTVYAALLTGVETDGSAILTMATNIVAGGGLGAALALTQSSYVSVSQVQGVQIAGAPGTHIALASNTAITGTLSVSAATTLSGGVTGGLTVSSGGVAVTGASTFQGITCTGLTVNNATSLTLPNLAGAPSGPVWKYLYWDSNTVVGRTMFGATISSSITTKRDVEPVKDEHIESLLTLKPIRFRYKTEVKDAAKQRKKSRNSKDAPYYFGLSAEHVIGAGLSDLVMMDDNGIPVTVYYDRIGAMLIPIINKQRARIEALEKKLEAV